MLYAEVNGQCTPIGSNNETKFTAAAVTTPTIYLNTDYPAPCSGTVSRWRYCFYRPVTHGAEDKYRLTLAVYRRMVTQYKIVESSQCTFTVDFPTQSNGFTCQYLDLSMSRNGQFDIEAGDIVGACIFNPSQGDRERMDIVSEANGYSLMRLPSNTFCGYNSIPRTISSSQLLIVNSRLLHLSATITSRCSI